MRPLAAALHRASLIGLLAGLSMVGGCMLIGYDGHAPAPTHDGSTMLGPDASTTHPDGALDGSKRDAGHDLSQDGGRDDVGIDPDASTGNPDASTTGEPDSSTGNPDAGAGDADASTSDPDASTGTPDAGTGDPGGPWWESVPKSSPCTALPTCPQQCTAATSPCHFECNKTSCSQVCDKGTQCRAECSGTSCGFECRANAVCSTSCSGLGCNVSCAAGSNCDHECRGATGCSLNCEVGAKCLLRHSTSLTANLNCSVPVKACPGNIVVCNRDCPAP